MKQIIKYVQSCTFWNIVFKTVLIALLFGIFISLYSLSKSIERMPNWFQKDTSPKIQKGLREMPKKQEPLGKNEKTNTWESQTVKQWEPPKEVPSFWSSFWGGDDTQTKTGSGTSTGGNDTWSKEALPKADLEKRYNFKCDGWNLLRIYEWKYEIRGQKSSLEAGKIALDDPQDGRIHFLTKIENSLWKATYEKIVSHFENGKDATYRYTLTTFLNGEAIFTKNGKNLYNNCKITK